MRLEEEGSCWGLMWWQTFGLEEERSRVTAVSRWAEGVLAATPSRMPRSASDPPPRCSVPAAAAATAAATVAAS